MNIFKISIPIPTFYERNKIFNADLYFDKFPTRDEVIKTIDGFLSDKDKENSIEHSSYNQETSHFVAFLKKSLDQVDSWPSFDYGLYMRSKSVLVELDDGVVEKSYLYFEKIIINKIE